ncbi:MAG TPA: glycosyl transferase, partial [Roseiflexaceae bacterium]|nr:glycosyl transferase [Roseiflexaceae bacterium]
LLARFPVLHWPRWRVAGSVIAGGVLAANLAWYHPYELAYYNPLLGGSAAAVRAIPVGWGEGYELAGDYVRAQPNGADRPVAALYEPVLDPYVPQGAAPMDWAFEAGRVDYAVLYIDQIQRQYKPYLITPLQQGQSPVYTVRVHGIEYAYVYQIAPPAGTPISADFGDAIRLRGYSIDPSALRASGVLTVTLQWQGRMTPAGDYNIFVHVFDAGGQKVGQVDVPLGDPRWPSHAWSQGRYIPQVQQVPLPAGLPPGTYTITLGVYDPHTFARLPLASSAPHSALDGADALQFPAVQFP